MHAQTSLVSQPPILNGLLDRSLVSLSCHRHALDMEYVSGRYYSAITADWRCYSIECNIVIVAACIPTLRPLFLVIFRRPGRERYLNHGIHERSSGSRDRCKRIGRISVPISDSTTAIGHIDYEETWIELDIDHQSCHRHGGIRQTLEVDVTSHKTSLEEEDMFTARRSINHLESEIRPN